MCAQLHRAVYMFFYADISQIRNTGQFINVFGIITSYINNYYPAKAREYFFTGVGLFVCVCLSVCDHDN